MNLYRGGICVTDGTDACIGGDSTAEAGIGSLIGYLKSSSGTGTVPVYRSTCYGSGGSCTGWGLSLDQNGTAVGYLSTTAPDGPSANNPFVQSNGVLLQGIPGTPSAYLWSPQSQLVAQTDHIYNNGSEPSGYTASGLVAYLEQNTAAGNTPLYRYVNTTTQHHYYSTTSDQPPGFVSDGILGYVRTASDLATVGLYRHYSASTGDYLLSTSSTPPTGYELQATLGYVYTTPSFGSGSLQDLVYHYDQVGNVTAIVDNIFTGSRIFSYDALNRLETAYGYFGTNQAIKDCTYSYSSIGNITNKCGVEFTYGDPLHPSAVTAISTGKTYTYDANGNMLTGGGRTFAWDVDNRVTSVTMGGTTSMEYDYTGMRVKKNGGGTTLYPFAGVEIDPNNNVMTKFIRIGNENFASNKGGVQYFYHNDHLGGVNVITDGNGARCQLNEYDPWGSVSKQDGNCDSTHKFTGKELDPETGLYYYGGRYYDPEISRFISPDPFVQDPTEPQNLNRYSYVDNNPVGYIDPSGYFYMSKSGGGSGGLFGMIFTAIIGLLTGNPEIAIASIAVELIVAQLPAKARHGMEIFGGIAMLLGGNPGGMFYVSAGAVGLSGSSGSEHVSGMLSGLGGVTSFLAGASASYYGAPSGGGVSGAGSSGFGGVGVASAGAADSGLSYYYYNDGVRIARITGAPANRIRELTTALDRLFNTPVGAELLGAPNGPKDHPFRLQVFPERSIGLSKGYPFTIELGLHPGSVYFNSDPESCMTGGSCGGWFPVTIQRAIAHELGHVYAPWLSENQVVIRFENPMTQGEPARSCYGCARR
jgi:RHS repeat-associated protein